MCSKHCLLTCNMEGAECWSYYHNFFMVFMGTYLDTSNICGLWIINMICMKDQLALVFSPAPLAKKECLVSNWYFFSFDKHILDKIDQEPTTNMSRSGMKNLGISFVGCIWKWRCVCTESLIKILLWRLLRHSMVRSVDGGTCALFSSWRFCFRRTILVVRVLSRTVDDFVVCLLCVVGRVGSTPPLLLYVWLRAS